MENLVSYLGCGNCRIRNKKNTDVVEFAVEKFSDITEKILPFFDKYPMMGGGC